MLAQNHTASTRLFFITLLCCGMGVCATAAPTPDELAAARRLIDRAVEGAKVTGEKYYSYGIKALAYSIHLHQRLPEPDRKTIEALLAEAKRIRDLPDAPAYRSAALAEYAVALAASGDLRGADKALEPFTGEQVKQAKLAEIILMSARTGDLPTVLTRLNALASEKMMNPLNGKMFRAGDSQAAATEATVALIFARQGKQQWANARFEGALRRATSREDYETIVSLALEAGQLDFARRAVRMIKPGNARDVAQLAIYGTEIRSLIAAEEKDKALRLMASAKKLAAEIRVVNQEPPDVGHRVEPGDIFGELALTQIASGLNDDAKQTVERAMQFKLDPNVGHYNPKSHPAIIRARAALGDLAAAKADAIENQAIWGRIVAGVGNARETIWESTGGVPSIAIIEAENGDFNAAWETIGKLEAAWDVVGTARVVGVMQARSMKPRELVQQLGEIRDAVIGSWACLGAAEFLLNR